MASDTILVLLGEEVEKGRYVAPGWATGLQGIGFERADVEQSVSLGLLNLSLIERSKVGKQAVGTRQAAAALDALRHAALTLLRNGFTAQEALHWLTTPLDALDHQRPVDCIRTLPGRVRVLAYQATQARFLVDQVA